MPSLRKWDGIPPIFVLHLLRENETMLLKWTLVFLTSCGGPLGFLNDSPQCWRDYNSNLYQYDQLEDCLDTMNNDPPASNHAPMDCQLREAH
jgi:hypothetical protein